MIGASLYAELQKLCLRSFPERLEQRISQVQPLKGERHPMLAFTLSWRQGRQPRVEQLILRRYADAWTWWSLADRGKAQREWAVMRWLYGEGLPVPPIYALTSADAVDALLMARAPGRTGLYSQGDEPSKGGALSVPESLVDALANLLAQLHGLMPPGAVRELLPHVLLSEERARLAGIARECEDGGLMEAISELRVDDLEVLPPCVLHGDPEPGNLLCDARGVTALLDWENSALGDPRWDIARVVNGLRSHSADELAARFCQTYAAQAERSLPDMPVWETLAAVQRWATVLQASHASDDGPSRQHVKARSEKAWRALTRWRRVRQEPSAFSP